MSYLFLHICLLICSTFSVVTIWAVSRNVGVTRCFPKTEPLGFLSDVLKLCQSVSIVLLGSNFYSQVNIWLTLELTHVDCPSFSSQVQS